MKQGDQKYKVIFISVVSSKWVWATGDPVSKHKIVKKIKMLLTVSKGKLRSRKILVKVSHSFPLQLSKKRNSHRQKKMGVVSLQERNHLSSPAYQMGNA